MSDTNTNRASAASVVDYSGPDPSVECAYPPCKRRLRKSDYDGPQWCSKEHREATTKRQDNWPLAWDTEGVSRL